MVDLELLHVSVSLAVLSCGFLLHNKQFVFLWLLLAHLIIKLSRCFLDDPVDKLACFGSFGCFEALGGVEC